jgi:rubredoxin
MLVKDSPQGKPKRRWIPYYKLNVDCNCPDCHVPCIVGKVLTGTDGKPVQHRYCPNCTFSLKVPLPASEAK